MIVRCIGFGRVWSMHEEFDESRNLDRDKCRWFNTTGIPPTPTSKNPKKFRRAYNMEGTVRFNMRAFDFVHDRCDLVGINVFFSGIEKYGQTNRMIISDPAHRHSKIDAYLVGVRSSEHGWIDFANPWKKGEAQIVSASEFRGEQDTLLLQDLTVFFSATEAHFPSSGFPFRELPMAVWGSRSCEHSLHQMTFTSRSIGTGRLIFHDPIRKRTAYSSIQRLDQALIFASVARLRVGSQVFSKQTTVGVDIKTRIPLGSTANGRNNSKPAWHSYPKKKGTRFGIHNQGVERRPDGCLIFISSRRKPDGRAGIFSCFTRVEA